MVVSAKIGSIHFDKSTRKQIGANQIYSPSRLYSITMANDIVLESKMLTENNITILNCATQEVFKYKLETMHEKINDKQKGMKINATYWLSDNIIVGITQRKESVTQSVYKMNHGKQTMQKIETRIYNVGAASLYKNSQTFSSYLATIVMDNIDYIVWFGVVDLIDHRFCFHLLPKNPFAPVKAKKFYASVFHEQEIFEDLFDKISFPESSQVAVAFPTSTHNNKLLCRLLITMEENLDKILSVFGTYVAIDLEQLIDVAGMEVNNLDLDNEQVGAYSLLQIPRPAETEYEDFYKLHNAEIFQAENYYSTHEHTRTTHELNIINLDTLEYKNISIPLDACSGFSPHPNGFILQWWVERDHIEFKKINFSWKSDSLEEIARKQLIFNHTVDISEIDLMRRIIYPGSTGRIQKLMGKDQNYLNYFYIGVLVGYVGYSVYNMFN